MRTRLKKAKSLRVQVLGGEVNVSQRTLRELEKGLVPPIKQVGTAWDAQFSRWRHAINRR